MTAQLDTEQTLRLGRAEARWLAQCAERLHRAALEPTPTPAGVAAGTDNRTEVNPR